MPRRSPHEGFDLAELRPLAHQSDYLRPEPGTPPPYKSLTLYACGDARRGSLLLLAEWHGSGTLLVVKPRGAALSDAVKAAVAAHPMAARCGVVVEGADSWEQAISP